MLVIARKAAALHDPGEGALDHPSAEDDDETFHPWHATDDLECDVGPVLRSCDEAPGITAIREDVLDEREAPARSFQHALRPVAILNVGAVNLEREQAAIGIGQNVPLICARC